MSPMNSDLKIIHLTHGDLDGAGCAVISKLLFGDNVEILAGSADNSEMAFLKLSEDLVKEDGSHYNFILAVTDLVLPREAVDAFIEEFGEGRLLIADHHPESQPLADLPYAFVDLNMCATKIYAKAVSEMMEVASSFYEGVKDSFLSHERTLLPEGTEEFFNIVNAWDMWLLEDPLRPDAENLNRLLWFLDFDRFVEIITDHYSVGRDKQDSLRDFIIDNSVIFAALKEEEQEYVNQAMSRSLAYETAGGTLKVGWVVASRHVSRVAERLILAKAVDVAIIYNIENNSVHIRTAKGKMLHAGQMAAMLFGGGGHASAGGGAMDYMKAAIQRFKSRPVIPLPILDAEMKQKTIKLEQKKNGKGNIKLV